jgi:hypothetical protein
MKYSTMAFIGLCAAAAGAQLLEGYGRPHWDKSVDYPVLVAGFVLLLVLFIWSIIGITRHLTRAIVGLLICAYCVWQAYQNGNLNF